VTFVKEDQTQQIYENKISALEQEIAEMRISLAKVMEDKAKLDGSHQVSYGESRMFNTGFCLHSV